LLIIVSIVSTPQVVPLLLLAAILGLPAVLIMLTSRRFIYIYWMIIYLAALPIWNFVLPVYAFWHFDDFSWGQTRKVVGDTGHAESDASVIGPDTIPLRRWDEWERDRRANIVIAFRRRTSKSSRTVS
jgi:chitin synthase